MRVKKIFNDNATDLGALSDPCANAQFGQAEDYTVNVCNLAVSDLQKNKSVIYPNPVKDVVTINSASKIENIKILNLLEN